jgi:predicted RNA-binding protein with TRAM domain
VEINDMHESGAGVGRQAESGFIVMVDGVLPPARVRAEISKVKPNFARADLIEKLPDEPEDEEEEGDEEDADDGEDTDDYDDEEDERLGSRENFWGN